MPHEKESNPFEPTRRTFLSAIGPLIGSDQFDLSQPVTLGGRPRNQLPSIEQRQHEASNPEPVLDFPDDPFIVAAWGNPFLVTRAESRANWESPLTRQGYEATTINEKVRTLFGLHPDVLDTHTLDDFKDGQPNSPQTTMEMLWFATRTGLPAAGGNNFAVMRSDPDVASDRYGAIMERNGWRYPDGTPLDNPSGIFAETFDGRDHTYDDRANVPSVFAPGTLDLIVLATETRLRQGFAGFWADGGVGVWLQHGLDFSVWATAAFRSHLSSLSPSRLSDLGIDDPGTFDIIGYLRDEDLTPGSVNDPRSDPVFREYLLHHHRGIKAFCEAYRSAVEEQFPARMAQGQIKLWTNQFMGNFEAPQAANIYVSDSFDIMHPEIYPTVQPGVGFKYKLLQALGRFSKPIMVAGNISPFNEPRIQEFDPGVSYRMLQRFLLGEAYANGAVFKLILTPSHLHLDTSFEHWVRADGTVPDELQSFIDFLWAHRRFLDAGEPDARVAVIWSLPTRLWRYEPQWKFVEGERRRLESFVGTVRLLREAQVPYDVLVFGHPRLWEDADQLDRLASYDVVVLPGVECLTEDQRVALERYLDADGTVITSGQPPARTQNFVPADAVASLFERDAVTNLSEDPGYRRSADGRSDGSLIDAVTGAGVDPMTVAPDRTLAVTRRHQPADSRTVVHLLNYDYTRDSDEFTTKEGFELRVRQPNHEVGVARYYAPQRTTDLEFSMDSGTIRLTVPALVEWGFVVLAPSSDYLVEHEARPEARELLEEADRRIARAEEIDRNWGPDYERATVESDAAKTALEFQAYDQATRAAEAAIEAIEKTYPRPVVGIDIAHHQLETIDQSAPFEWLDEHFDGYRFEQLRDWDRSTLKSVDVLLVPPVLGADDAAFGYSPEELDRVERFVGSGGSLVVFARGGVADDIDALTERFGYRFDGAPIVFPEGTYGDVPVTSSHPLMKRVNAVTARYATPITRLPDHAEVLASVPADSGAWLSSESPLERRSDREESAAGLPIFATGHHGDGQVLLLGQSNYLLDTREAQDFMEVVYELLTVLGRRSVNARRGTASDGGGTEPTESRNAGSSRSPSAAQQPTTSDGQPGFSILIGLLGIVAGLLGYVRNVSPEIDQLDQE